MKKVLLGVLLSAISLSICASDAPDRALALRYLESSKLEDAVNATIAEYEAQFVKTDATPEQKAKFHELFESTMGWAKTKDQLADLVTRVYTKEELEAAIAFMSTSAGASYAAKNAEFSKQWSSVVADNLKKVASQKASPSK